MKVIIRNGLVAAILAISQPAFSETSTPETANNQNTAGTTTQQIWENTKTDTRKAVDWTIEKSKQGWNKTKTFAGNAADWTVDKTSRAWDATKESTSNAADWVKEKTEASHTSNNEAPIEDRSF